MYNKIQTQQLFLNKEYGLQRTFETLSLDNTDGVSKEEMLTSKKISVSDYSFIEELYSNFSTIDTNKDGNITSDEFSDMMNELSQNGLSYQQLLTMSTQASTGEVKSLLSTVVNHFNEVDINKDGKVSSAEIDNYQFEKEMQTLLKPDLSKVSIFYSSKAEDDEEKDTDNDSLISEITL